jgi:hypothetical protein
LTPSSPVAEAIFLIEDAPPDADVEPGSMRSKSTGEDDRTIAITPAIVPSGPWSVVDVDAGSGFRLAARFLDGTHGECRIG